VLYSGKLLPHLKTIDLAGKVCQGQILKLIADINNLGKKKAR
jgi:hypothetical protein